MDGLLNSPGQVDALHLRNTVAFLLELLLAPLLNVIGSLAILLVLKAALLTGDSFLNRPLRNLTLTLLDICTDGVGDIMALPPGDGVIHGLGHLLTDLLGDLAAHRLRGSCPDHGRGVALEGDLEESQEKCRCENCLHLPLWTTEPNRVVKFKKKFFFLFLAKNHYNYMGEGHFRPEQVGTSHFRAPMGPKTAKNGHFGQF